MKKFFSFVINVVLIASITIGLIVGGLALLHIGSTPLYVQLLHLLGFLFFVIGVVVATVMLFIAYISIHDYLNPPDQKCKK